MTSYDPGRRIRLEDGVSAMDWADARSIAREHLPREHGDEARFQHDADRIRRLLALPSYRDHTIEMACFNAEDAREIERRLSDSDRSRVRFVYPVDRHD